MVNSRKFTLVQLRQSHLLQPLQSDSDHPYDAPLINEPFNSVPPLSTMKAVNSSSSSSSNFLRKTDRMPKEWKDELRALIVDTIDRHLEEREPVSSHNRKRKNTYDDDDLESIATAPKQRKRPGKVEAQPLLSKGYDSGNDSESDVGLWPPAERARFQLSPSSIKFEQGSLSLF